MYKLIVTLLTLIPTLLFATPLAPSGLTLTAGEHSVHLSWQDNAKNETGYKILRDNVPIKILGKNSTSYHDNNLVANREYNYTVKATDDAPEGTMINSTKETFGTDGEALTFRLYNFRGAADDWLGLFKKGDVLNRDNLLGYTRSEGMENGQVTVNTYSPLESGEYEVVAFYNDSYLPESISYFHVSDVVTLQTTKDVYDINEAEVTVDISNATLKDNNEDWIGVYKQNDANIWEKQKGWIFNNANGRGIKHGKVTIQDSVDLSTPGRYEVRFFLDNTMNAIAKSAFVVGDEVPLLSHYGERPDVTVIRKRDDEQVKIYHRENTLHAPVVVLLPGWSSKDDTTNLQKYIPLLDFIASQGYYVIGFEHNYYSITNVQHELEAAALDDKADTTRVAVLGHSLGGANMFRYQKKLKEDYGQTKSAVISLDGYFAFDMTPDDMHNFDSKALFLAFGGADGILNEGENIPHYQDPKVNYAAYSMLGSEEKAFLHIEADNNHGYPYSPGLFSEKIELLRPIHAFLDYSLKGDDAAKNIALLDNHQDVLNYINNEQGNLEYEYGCKYPWNDDYDYCNLNNLLSYKVWQHPNN